MAAGALSPPMTSTAARTLVLPEFAHDARGAVVKPQAEGGASTAPCARVPLRRLLLFHRQRQLRVHIAAVVAGGVRELGVAALRAADVVDRLQRVVRTAFALARLADSLDRKHD